MGTNGLDGGCEVPVGRKYVCRVELIALSHHDKIDSQHYVHGLLNHYKTTAMISSDLHEILKYASVNSLPQVNQITVELAAGWTLDPSLLQSA